jgi:hypothetical protein
MSKYVHVVDRVGEDPNFIKIGSVASTTEEGLVAFATSAETIARTNSSKAVTPAGLGAFAPAVDGVLEVSKIAVVGLKGQLDWSSITPTFAAATGRDNAFVKMGTWATPITIVQTDDHWVPFQINIKKSGNIQFDTAAARLRVDTNGAQALSHIGCLQLRQNLAHNVGSSAIINASINISAAVAVGLGSILGGYFSIEGSGAITKAGSNDCTPLVAVNNNTGGGVDNVFIAMQNGVGTTVTEIAKIVAVHGTATNGLHIYATPTDSSIVTALRINKSVIQGIRIGEWVGSAALGSAVVFSTAMNVNGDDSQYDVVAAFGESASDLGSGKSAKVGRFRHVINGITASHETYGLVGQVVVKNVTVTHLHAGLMGTFEVNTAATINSGYVYGTAGVIARIGVGTSILTCTKAICGFSSIYNGGALAGGAAYAYGATSVTATTWAALLAADKCDNLLYVASATAYESGVLAGSITVDDATALAGVIRISIAGTPYYIPLFVAGDLTGE